MCVEWAGSVSGETEALRWGVRPGCTMVVGLVHCCGPHVAGKTRPLENRVDKPHTPQPSSLPPSTSGEAAGEGRLSATQVWRRSRGGPTTVAAVRTVVKAACASKTYPQLSSCQTRPSTHNKQALAPRRGWRSAWVWARVVSCVCAASVNSISNFRTVSPIITSDTTAGSTTYCSFTSERSATAVPARGMNSRMRLRTSCTPRSVRSSTRSMRLLSHLNSQA